MRSRWFAATTCAALGGGAALLSGCGPRPGAEPPPAAPPAEAVTGATPVPYETGGFATIASSRGILIHCGNSMRPAAEALAAEFQRRTGIAVHFQFGGSAELLAGIELGRRGDLYLCHDPYAERLAEKNLLADVETVGALYPLLLVPRGNPRNIVSARSLAEPGLRVALPDARYATAGRLAREALRREGLEEAVDARRVMEGRSHNDVALAVLSGHADAGIVWNFLSVFYRDRLDAVELGLAVPPTRVTLCLLTTAEDEEAARAFLSLARSAHGRKVFLAHGYAGPEDDPAPEDRGAAAGEAGPS